jgi:hypothetical protein
MSSARCDADQSWQNKEKTRQSHDARLEKRHPARLSYEVNSSPICEILPVVEDTKTWERINNRLSPMQKYNKLQIKRPKRHQEQ